MRPTKVGCLQWFWDLQKWYGGFYPVNQHSNGKTDPEWRYISYCFNGDIPAIAMSVYQRVHPRNLTWNLKRSPQKRKFLLETIIFRFHVKFRGVTSYSMTFWDVLLSRGPASSCQREADHQGLVNRCFWCGHGKKLLGLEETCPFALRIIGPSYRGTWTCIAGFRDLQTTSFEIPRFLGWGFIYDKIFSFFVLLGFFLRQVFFFTWTQTTTFFLSSQLLTFLGKIEGLDGWSGVGNSRLEFQESFN